MLNAFRNLYKIRAVAGDAVVAFITAGSAERALDAYRSHGGAAAEVYAEQMTFGYYEDVCSVYA